MKVLKLSDLRDLAIQQLEMLMKDEIESEHVNSFCKISNMILATVKAEIDYMKAMNINTPISFLESDSQNKLLA